MFFKKISLVFAFTRMKTFIKNKLKKYDDQTNIDKYRVAVNKNITIEQE